ncbi:hypothetical protein BC937DRAFT_89815 [Endogone sp. FLAS-F59071]|nr:hypothetical protein BC937DRAFT_89815 [Endogone sp. FLAS-F59071]|eukprot:RUS17555.1 hypothetical protein BC937DRAFT_89815 [Endogone sp. FLAS-F59071]
MHGTTTVILSTLLLTLASFSFSYDSSIYTIVYANFVHSNANPPILTDDVFQVTYLVASVVSACIMAPLLCDFIGRRLTMLLAGILLTVGSAVQSSSDGLINYYVGRLIAALAAGTLWIAVFLHVAEVAPKEFRGAAICLQVRWVRWVVGKTGGQVWALDVGQLTGEMFQRYLQGSSWRFLTEVGCILAAFLCVGVYFLPTSPRWLLSKGRDQDALIVLAHLRADGDPGAPVVQDEYDGIKSAVDPERQARSGWSDLLRGSVRRRLVLAVAMGLFPNLIVAMTIEQWVAAIGSLDSDASASGFEPWVVVVAIAYATPLIPIVAIDRVGRRRILIVGAIVLAICTMCIGILATSLTNTIATEQSPSVIVWGTGTARWGALSLSFVAIAAYHLTLSPISWLYPVELFPTSSRAKALGLVTSIRWVFNYFLPSAFAQFLVISPIPAVFVILVVCIVLIMIAWYCLPETAVISLEEIEVIFANWGPGSSGSGRASVMMDFIVHGSSPSRSRHSTPLGWLRTQYHGGESQRANSIGTLNTDGDTPYDLTGSAFDLPRTATKRGLFGYVDKDQLKRYNNPPTITYYPPPPLHPPPLHSSTTLQSLKTPHSPTIPHSPPPRSPKRSAPQSWRSSVIPAGATNTLLAPPSDADAVRPDSDIDNVVHEPSGPRYTSGGTTIEATTPRYLSVATAENVERYMHVSDESVSDESVHVSDESVHVSDDEPDGGGGRNDIEPDPSEPWYSGGGASTFTMTPHGSPLIGGSRRVSGQRYSWRESAEHSNLVLSLPDEEDSSYTYI